MKRFTFGLFFLLCLTLSADAASRFWVGGTGTWDATTTHWSATSGGANGVSAPVAADDVTFDGSSGGGTVTVNTTVNINTLTMGAFTGTLDFATNNNNLTSTTVNISGAGTRTLNMGNGTWTLTATGGVVIWSATTTTNLTFNRNSSTILLSRTASLTQAFTGGNLTYNTVTVNTNTGGGALNFSGANTFANLTISGQNTVTFPSSTTTTITNAFTWVGTSSAAIGLASNAQGTSATISVASGSPTMSWAAMSDMTFSGGATFTATSSLNLGHNSGITIIAPTTGGSGGGIIGGWLLRRDLAPPSNDNAPMFLAAAA